MTNMNVYSDETHTFKNPKTPNTTTTAKQNTKSPPKFDLGAKTQPLVTLYVNVTNHALYVTRVVICYPNLHV